MANDRNRPTPERDEINTPEENVANVPESGAAGAPLDPNDEVPVPIAMYPAEIDERAQVVEALREESSDNRTNDDTGISP